MPVRVSEAFVLRTYPFKEADLVVSFFTRDQGKLRGIARRARRPKGGFGSGLERLTQVRVSYFQRENRELVTLDNCELIRSQFDLSSNYEAGIGLDYIAEVAEHLLPSAETNERFYRLLAAVLEYFHAGGDMWTSVLYFSFWAVRLSGFLPDLGVNSGVKISADSRALATEILTKPIAEITARAWSKSTAYDLRRFLVKQIEEHVERRLLTVPLLESL
jgi:DNA repair protein RecO (recombination protein O)